MTRPHKIILTILILLVFTCCIFVYAMRSHRVTIDQYTSIERPPAIKPDYSATTIPPNIAPLNFLVQEEGKRYYVKIYSKQGNLIEVFSKTPQIVIPGKLWSTLLTTNKGQELCFDVFVKNENDQWNLFSTIRNKIAGEEIDGFLLYRKMHPTHTHYNGLMGVYQRNLSNFRESVILNTRYDKIGCVNCHTFNKKPPIKMLLGVRGEDATGTLLIEDDKVSKIGTKFGYTSWHPSGRLAVYNIISLPMHFHTRSTRDEVRDTINLNSALAYYVLGTNEIKTSPNLSQKDRLETWPAWSGDGRHLYFCSAPILDSKTTPASDNFPPAEYKQVKYDLMRISYDIDRDKWGKLETILSHKDIGDLSITMPHISPDGRWLIFTACDYGFFPTWQKSGDLYLMDLETTRQTGKYECRRLRINSDQSESWQSWSSNSRWIVFSSKRDYGVFTKPYISYVDPSGQAHKPLLLPQKHPDFYDSCLLTYNTPELTSQPVRPATGKLARVFRGSRQIDVTMPITMATPKSGQESAGIQDDTWQRE